MASTIWKGHLTFGLVSVPIKLFLAARAEKIHMHLLQRHTGARVRRVFVPAEDVQEPEPAKTPLPESRPAVVSPVQETAGLSAVPAPRQISKPDLVHGFEYEKDKYVEFEPGELEDLAPRSSSEMQIIEFVSFAEVDPVYLENSYYVAPDKQGEKPYALLFEALRKTGQSAIGEFVMHRRDQIILLRAGRQGIIGHTLFHEDEVRRETEFRADDALVVPKEMELAIKLVDALAAPFEPGKFKDKYRERLHAAISERVASGAQEVKPGSQMPAVIDIMAALQASLKNARKPAASERGASKAVEAPAKKKRGILGR